MSSLDILLSKKGEESREEGRREGHREGILSVAKNLKLSGHDTDYISKVTGLSKDDISLL